MLANRKLQGDVYEQHVALPIKKCSPKLDIALRAQCLITVVLVAIGAMFLTVRSEAIIRTGYDLVQLKSQALKLQNENEQLRLDIAKLRSSQRIQYIATAELGMVVPKDVYFIENVPQKVQTNTGKEKNIVSQVVNNLQGGGKD